MSSSQEALTSAEQDERYLELIPSIEDEAKSGYDDRLLFHPWSHALEVREEIVNIREKLIETGKTNVRSRFLSEVEALLHDYGYMRFMELKKTGHNPYKSSEHLAVTEGGDLLKRHGVDDATIKEYRDDVWGTKLGVRCRSWGKMTLCLADLSNTQSDYDEVFAPATERLRQETEIIEDKEIDPNLFAISSLVVLSRYYWENLSIPRLLLSSKEFRERRANMRRNLVRLGSEQAAHAGEQVLSFAYKLGNPVWNLFNNLNEPKNDDEQESAT